MQNIPGNRRGSDPLFTMDDVEDDLDDDHYAAGGNAARRKKKEEKVPFSPEVSREIH